MQLNFFKFENSANVSNLNNKIKEFDEKNVLSGIAANYNETDDAFIVDLVRKYYDNFLIEKFYSNKNLI
jgi:hypothetical protein